MNERRSEILKRLEEIQNELDRLFNDSNYRNPKLEPALKEEAKKLLLEYASTPVEMEPMILKAYTVFKLPNGETINPSKGTKSFYLGGKPYYIEFDEYNQPIKITSTVFDERIRQPVLCFYNVQIQLVQTVEKEPERVEPLKPTTIQEQAPTQKTVDWLMKTWECTRCHFENMNRFDICRNCGLSKIDSDKLTKDEDVNKSKEDKKGYLTGKLKRIQDHFNKE